MAVKSGILPTLACALGQTLGNPCPADIIRKGLFRFSIQTQNHIKGQVLAEAAAGLRVLFGLAHGTSLLPSPGEVKP